MDFGRALDALREGLKVQRTGWNGKPVYIVLKEVYSKESKGSTAEIFCPTQGDLVPWLASQTDILAEDWGIV